MPWQHTLPTVLGQLDGGLQAGAAPPRGTTAGRAIDFMLAGLDHLPTPQVRVTRRPVVRIHPPLLLENAARFAAFSILAWYTNEELSGLRFES